MRLDPPTLRTALVPPDPDLTRLPVDFYPGPTPLFGVLLMIGGVIGPIVVGLTLGLIGLAGDQGPIYGWIVLGMACIPLLALPWGWWVIRSRTIVRIGANMVEYMRVTPLRTVRWTAPLADYDAVAYRKVLPPSSSKAGTTMHAVDLCHTGGGTLRLVTATEEDLARDVQMKLSALTGLTAKVGETIRPS